MWRVVVLTNKLDDSVDQLFHPGLGAEFASTLIAIESTIAMELHNYISPNRCILCNVLVSDRHCLLLSN
jgi:hypothetical protein